LTFRGFSQKHPISNFIKEVNVKIDEISKNKESSPSNWKFFLVGYAAFPYSLLSTYLIVKHFLHKFFP